MNTFHPPGLEIARRDPRHTRSISTRKGLAQTSDTSTPPGNQRPLSNHPKRDPLSRVVGRFSRGRPCIRHSPCERQLLEAVTPDYSQGEQRLRTELCGGHKTHKAASRMSSSDRNRSAETRKTYRLGPPLIRSLVEVHVIIYTF